MKVDTKEVNPAFQSIIQNPKQKVFLDDMQIVQMYELIYYLYKTGRYDNKALRILYKYQYYLTSGDKRINPEWGCFIEQMDLLYNGIL